MEKIFALAKKDKALRKILKFFHDNPNSVDTSENIAKWIGENEKIVRRRLNYLVKKHLLNKDETYVTAGYSYTQNMDSILKISEFIKGLKDE